MPWLFFLKDRAEVESADHLYAVEDGFRKQYADFGGETKSQQVEERWRWRWLTLSLSLIRLLNESSSLLIAETDEYPSESHQQRYSPFRPYAIVVPRVEGILSRMLCIQNVEQ